MYGAAEATSFAHASAAFDPEHVQQTITTLRDAANEAVHVLAKAYEAEVRRFRELQHAAALAEERLKLVNELEVGASSASELIARVEEERSTLERDIASRKRDWEREQEEAAYQATLARKRAADAAAEEQRKREQALKEREAALKEREAAVAAAEKNGEEIKQRIEQLPAELERESAKRIGEAKKLWDAELKRLLAEKDTERDYARTLAELEKKNLQQELARVQAECTALRKDAETASRKAQELAVRIVERGTGEWHSGPLATVPGEAGRKE